MHVAGMRILRVVDIRGEMRNHLFQWFGYVMRWGKEDLIRAFLGLRVLGRLDRCRPNLA